LRFGSWLNAALRRSKFLRLMRERQHVKRTCRDCLALYRQGEAQRANTTAAERYAHVIASRTGADANGVNTILRRAEESFAAWPNDRPLTFRDVVQYLAVTERLGDTLSESGVRAHVAAIVARLIPEDL
jgi:hypothetical protein